MARARPCRDHRLLEGAEQLAMDKAKATPAALQVIRKATPEEIALQYIRHEFIKLFPGQTDTFYQQMADGVSKLPQMLGEDLFWKLLAGIAEGYKHKWIYRFLTDAGLQWHLEKIALNDMRMTGMSPFMDPILSAAGWQPAAFAKVWREHPEYAAQPEAAGMKPEPLRDIFPIMLVEKNNRLQVFDGMRRTCMAALAGKQEMAAWVGRRATPGKSHINTDKTLFLFATYAESDMHDEESLHALIGISKLVIREHANGREAVERALRDWDANPTMQAAAKKVRDAIQ